MKNPLLPLVLLLIPMGLSAQDAKDFAAQQRERFNQFRQQQRQSFEEFRREVNSKYAKFLEEAWHPHDQQATPPPPEEPRPIPPVVYDDKDGDTPEATPIEIRRVVSPLTAPVTPPQPIAPIDEIAPNLELIPIKGSRPVKPREQSAPQGSRLGGNKGNMTLDGTPSITPKHPTVSVHFLGTPLNVRWKKSDNISLLSTAEKQVAGAWATLSDGRADPLLRDCLDLRERLDLADWAYLKLLDAVAHGLQGNDTNEATLLMAWLYAQSGYKMRLATDDSRLYMLFASEHLIYSYRYYNLDGTYFYAYGTPEGTGMKVSAVEFPQERPLNLYISQTPRLASELSDSRSLRSKRYDLKMESQTNRNLLALFDSYPTSYMGGDIMTRWAMYASVPASDEFKEFLYPSMRRALEGKDKRQGADVLLNWVQTAFPYEYDENVWGEDRAFFADETLFYPACDCEDRSILFSRLVRDLLGLDVLLVYYPGHLATAVAFDEDEPQGDYLTLNGRRFTVCDPTYIGAGCGRTMPGMDNQQTQVILLN